MRLNLVLVSGVSLAVLGACAPTTTETAAAPQTAAATPAPASAPFYGSFGFDQAGMDSAVRPGDDFYAFANGTWARSTAIPADKSNYGMFTALGDLSLERTRTILEEARSDANSNIGRAYASFLDEAGIEARGMAPITPWLSQVRGLRSHADYPALAATADRAGIGTLFGGFVGQDDRIPENYIYTMGQAGIGLPDRDYYLEAAPRFVTIRAAYVAYLERMLTLAGEGNAAPRAAAIMAYETRLAEAHWNRIDSSDATKVYNKMTVAALQALAPGFDFAAYVGGVGAGRGEVLVGQPSAFTGMARAFAQAPIEVLRDQLIVRSLSTYSDQLPAAVADTDFAFYGTTLSGTPQRQIRWKQAVQFAEGVLGDEVGQRYVARYYPPATKAAMDTLVANVMAALGNRIDNLSWMQPATKVRARAKLANFTVKIGYPSQWRSYAGLEIRADDAFGNAWRSNQFEHAYNLGHLGTPLRRWEWGMNPTQVNAYANFGMNEIVFPAAILQPPFFDPNADPAINYGGIGAVIGHEISHHFDDQGAKYDEHGRLADWWTPADVAAFEAAGRQLIAQYDAYEVLGEHLSGEFTLGENIGDLAGLSIAYDAYKRSLNGHEAPVINGTTGDQRFFLGWAQVWRRNYRDANLLQRITTDPHSPSVQRAWVVRNLDAWYSAFNVESGGRLYLAPEARVRIW
ncbi:MAG: M13-type metalloendopeptidase [Sphingopyxis sp.]